MSEIFIYDQHLNPVLEKSTNQDLEPLVEYLKTKLSQALTIHPSYEKYHPRHTKYVDVIADEIRLMGGNSFKNLYRGEGPSYYEIVCDVADQFNAPYQIDAHIADIEKSIIQTIFKKAIEKLTVEEKSKLLEELRIEGMNVGGLTSTAMVAIFEAGGFYSYQLAVIIANQLSKLVLGHGLSFAANATLTKSLSILTGPIGWAVCALWSTINISGPSFKVSVPCVVHIAALRLKPPVDRCRKCSAAYEEHNIYDIKFCTYCTAEVQANYDKYWGS